MKTSDLATLAAVAVLGFVVWQMFKGRSAGGIQPITAANGGTAVEVPTIGGSGWRYFNDGTAIAPNGDYYHGGSLIWQASQ